MRPAELKRAAAAGAARHGDARRARRARSPRPRSSGSSSRRSTTSARCASGFPEVVFGLGQDARTSWWRSSGGWPRRNRGGARDPGGRGRARGPGRGVPATPRSTSARACVIVRRSRASARRGARARRGRVLVVCAGTADLPVAEEALVTARVLGSRAELIADVGVAGLHRLLAHREQLRGARVVVVVAGLEGALPSVVGGLDRPAGDRGADQRRLRRPLPRAWRRCSRCSTRARRA